MKQTAFEWLQAEFNKLSEGRFFISYDLLQEAKAMEKEQIMNAYIDGEHQQGFEGEAEQYYNETYNK